MGEIQREVREEKYEAVIHRLLRQSVFEMARDKLEVALVRLMLDAYDDGFDQGREEGYESGYERGNLDVEVDVGYR